ncbi:hypothetical protein V1460_30350 [Streptomyces sp. SCSIO 30461]|uniref:hypothetical protein n=1 Tax=Streptomyces sp. SCSIO 30461 TaxID=3118085 RepID=UPI0030D1EDDB
MELQRADQPPLGGLPLLDGFLHLVDGAVDPVEQRVIDGELPAGEPVQQAAVEGHTGLRPGQLAVQVHRAGMVLVQDAEVPMAPQGVDVVAAGRWLLAAGCWLLAASRR